MLGLLGFFVCLDDVDLLLVECVVETLCLLIYALLASVIFSLVAWISSGCFLLSMVAYWNYFVCFECLLLLIFWMLFIYWFCLWWFGVCLV